mmetsp:Transcript_24827/g.39131  ORF Transcript_24827/g.39131 Transcript_24827/m.39131 type:complete len:224 (-) Transcript_24827:219-890(-)
MKGFTPPSSPSTRVMSDNTQVAFHFSQKERLLEKEASTYPPFLAPSPARVHSETTARDSCGRGCGIGVGGGGVGDGVGFINTLPRTTCAASSRSVHSLMLYPPPSGRGHASVNDMTNSAKSESGQQNQGRENLAGLLGLNDSCIHPVPAEDASSFSTKTTLCVALFETSPSMIIAMGHMLDGMNLVCGDPIPAYAMPSCLPSWNIGLSLENKKRLVLANIVGS